MAILSGDGSPDAWHGYQIERLRIEQDEPPVFRALDLLCHNELALAEGFDRNDKAHFEHLTPWQRAIRHIFHWADRAV